VAGQEDTSLSQGLLTLCIAESVHGLYHCDARFGNWGPKGNSIDFLYFDRKKLDFGKSLQIKLDQDKMFDGRVSAIEAEFPEGSPPEIAVLLTLGFHPRSVLASFLAESALIALIGGVIGCLLALPINGVVTSTTNWASFSEIAFSFRVTPGLLLAGLVFAVVMGVLGGFFPARRAARVPVVQAIR